MKKFLVLISLLYLVSCQKEEAPAPVKRSQAPAEYDFTKKGTHSQKANDDFSDLKKKDDESCDTEEEITKKLAEPKQEAFQLQGGDTGCDVGSEEGAH